MTWNVPNLLTVARMALLPLVIFLLWPGIVSPSNAIWACVAYIIAGLLDVVDGAVARHLNQVTAIGKFLDPLVDKLFYLVTLIALLQLPGPWIPPWVVMVVLIRELAITGLRGIAGSEGFVIAADEGGKLKTFFATAGVVGLMLHHPYRIDLAGLVIHLDTARVGLWLTYISIVFSLLSGGRYVYKFLHAVRPAPLR